MKTATCAIAFLLLMACGNNSNETNGQEGNPTPAEVHPPSEALPDTLKLVNDSAVVPDHTGDADVKAKTGASDSLQKRKN